MVLVGYSCGIWDWVWGTSEKTEVYVRVEFAWVCVYLRTLTGSFCVLIQQAAWQTTTGSWLIVCRIYTENEGERMKSSDIITAFQHHIYLMSLLSSTHTPQIHFFPQLESRNSKLLIHAHNLIISHFHISHSFPLYAYCWLKSLSNHWPTVQDLLEELLSLAVRSCSAMWRIQLEKLCSCDLSMMPNQQKQISSIMSFAVRGFNSERMCGHIYVSSALPQLWLWMITLWQWLEETLWGGGTTVQ